MARRVSMGKHSDGAFGFRVSKPGIDVDVATDDDLVLDSDWVVENVFASGSLIVPKSASGETTVVDCSGLSYVPYVRAFINFENDAESWLGMPMLYRKLLYFDSSNVLKLASDVIWNPAGSDVILIYFVYARPVN